MPEGKTRPTKRTVANRAAVDSIGRGRSVLFAGAMLVALVLPINLVDSRGWVTVKPAFATHDNSDDRGAGHNSQGGGNSGGAGNPDNGGGPGDDDNSGNGGQTTASGSSGGNGRSGSASVEAAEIEDKVVREVIDAVEPVGSLPADAAATGLPTIREIFALSQDAVVGPEEERALIANGWTIP